MRYFLPLLMLCLSSVGLSKPSLVPGPCSTGFGADLDLVERFDVFQGIANGNEPAFRTLIWSGPRRDHVSMIYIAEHLFRLAFQLPKFQFKKIPETWTSHVLLKTSNSKGIQERNFSFETSDNFLTLLKSVIPTPQTKIHFLRIDVANDSDRIVSFSYSETDESLGEEYTLLMEWPLKFSDELIQYLLENHSDPTLKRAGSSTVEKFATVLNTES